MKYGYRHLDFIGNRRFVRLASLITLLITPRANARHLSEADVVALEKQCRTAEAPVFARIRQKQLLECQELESKNRGDPTTCAGQVKDVRPGGRFVLNPPLPICDEAFKARDHYRLNPK